MRPYTKVFGPKGEGLVMQSDFVRSIATVMWESDDQPLDHPFSELSRAPASTTTDYEYTPAKLREYAEMLAALADDEEQARQVREGVETAIRNGNRYRFFHN